MKCIITIKTQSRTIFFAYPSSEIASAKQQENNTLSALPTVQHQMRTVTRKQLTRHIDFQTWSATAYSSEYRGHCKVGSCMPQTLRSVHQCQGPSKYRDPALLGQVQQPGTHTSQHISHFEGFQTQTNNCTPSEMHVRSMVLLNWAGRYHSKLFTPANFFLIKVRNRRRYDVQVEVRRSVAPIQNCCMCSSMQSSSKSKVAMWSTATSWQNIYVIS